MIRGVYATASALSALLRRQEAVSQNLSNLNTPGFKQELTLMQDAPELGLVRLPDDAGGDPVGDLPTGVNGNDLVVDYSQGPLQSTGRLLDLAIVGDGFFRIQTPDGVRLTRDGTFHRDSTGRLVTADGGYLLGANGPIQIGEGSSTILEDGTIYMPGEAQPAGRIELATVADPAALIREDHNLLNPGGAALQPVTLATGSIKQGMIEQSNVDVSAATVTMMTALRNYEAAQRSFKLQDETIQRALEVGRLA